MQHHIDKGPTDPSGGHRVSFCSMPIDIVDPTDVFDRLVARPRDLPFAYVTTPNVDHVVRLRRNEADLLPLYQDAWITVCDSRVLAALHRSAYGHLPVTTGADLTDALLSEAIAPSDPINVIGADENVILLLKQKYRLTHINHLAPPMNLNERPQEIEKCVEFIEQHPARFTFLAVGSPQQEKIAHGAWARGKAKGVGLCIGYALLFSVGVTPRAPRYVQGLGLEWLHRLAQEPDRLARRYLYNVQIFGIFLQQLRLSNRTRIR